MEPLRATSEGDPEFGELMCPGAQRAWDWLGVVVYRAEAKKGRGPE